MKYIGGQIKALSFLFLQLVMRKVQKLESVDDEQKEKRFIQTGKVQGTK